MSGLFTGTPLERPITCEVCERPLAECTCPRDAAGNILLPRDQTAVIRLQKRRKGKVVTLITGLDSEASDLPGILKQLKITCATGGTITDDGTIEIQGDQRENVLKALKGMGYVVRES